MISYLKKVLRSNKYMEMLAYMLQNKGFINTSGSGEFGKSVDELYKHNVKVSELYMENFPDMKEKETIVEIGTGYTRATMLNIIKECRVEQAYCYDRFNCLHENDDKIIDKYELSSHLNRLQYISGVNNELLSIGEKSVDYIVSNAVLEHVDDNAHLFGILCGLLKPDGQMFHRVDLRCHNRFKRYGELYFHTFKQSTWNKMGDKIGHPNRMLFKDYVELFEQVGLVVDFKVIEEFEDKELDAACKYLSSIDMDDYKPAVVDFKLCLK